MVARLTVIEAILQIPKNLQEQLYGILIRRPVARRRKTEQAEISH